MRVLLAVVVFLLPAIQLVVMIQVFFGTSLFAFVPATDDEVQLWHEELTYAAVGFNGGYYTFEEQPALISASHFGAHGPFFPLYYGTLGRIVGWHPYTGVLFNVIAVTLVVGFFLLALRPNTIQIILLGGLLMTYWGLVYEIPTNNQEAFHLAFAIFVAALLRLLVRNEHVPSVWTFAALVGLILAASLVRPFWTLFLIPVALLATTNYRWQVRLVALFGASLLIGLFLAAYVALAAPFPYFLNNMMEALAVSFRDALRLLREKLYVDVPLLFGFGDLYPLSVLLRYQVFAVITVLTVALGLSLLKTKVNLLKRAGTDKTSLIILFTLGAMLVVLVFVYLPYGYQAQRMLAPYLLVALLLLLMEENYWLVLLVILTNVLTLPIFISTYQVEKTRNFRFDTVGVREFSDEVGDELRYDPTSGPWCNTVLIDGSLFCLNGRCDYALAIPAGQGLSAIHFQEQLIPPIKSEYLLLSEQRLESLENQLAGQLEVSAVERTPYGTLYKNNAADCPNAARDFGSFQPMKDR